MWATTLHRIVRCQSYSSGFLTQQTLTEALPSNSCFLWIVCIQLSRKIVTDDCSIRVVISCGEGRLACQWVLIICVYVGSSLALAQNIIFDRSPSQRREASVPINVVHRTSACAGVLYCERDALFYTLGREKARLHDEHPTLCRHIFSALPLQYPNTFGGNELPPIYTTNRYFTAIMSEVLKACGHNPDLCLTVTGFGDAGTALVASPNVDKIIFTGSPEVCRFM